MIFITDLGKRFGTIKKIFINEQIHESISIIGSIVHNGYRSPTNCGGVAENKKIAQIKGLAESIERRSLGINSSEESSTVQAFNLINREIEEVKVSLIRYSSVEPYVDTTGTAAHVNSNLAIFNAVSEILEKNAVFLFWYGKRGRKFKSSFKTIYTTYLEKQGYEVHFFLIEEFLPLNIVITIAISSKNSLNYKFGIGSALLLNEAILKSTSEAYLLGNYYESLYYSFLNGYSYSDDLDKFFDKKTLDYVFNLIKAPTIKQESISTKNNILNNEEFYNMLPSWIIQLLICILPQKINQKFIVVKVVSNQLYNHIPKKDYLDLNKPINRQTINLHPDQLEIIPDCPIV
ncbi:YcaO-like family protein [Lysinibacillus capsici]|uniref:YcaO-like family protein n=1 Tax=Lysinibacillus capsici TaxID=2115968 RepID=UPI002DB805B9|nr:YcaO-like family protein [Lysinibacillus capsici]MEC1302876.1 YcaO-like family protein [Lysinibacillus capsici]